MKKQFQEIITNDAPRAIGPYSQAIQAGGFLFVSGQVAIDIEAGKIIDESIQGQTKLVLNHIEAILKKAGLALSDVVKTEIFLKDMNDFQEMNKVYAEFFSHDIKPARQTVQVVKLPMDALIEISCIAMSR